MIKSRLLKIITVIVGVLIIVGIAISVYLSRVVAPPLVDKQFQKIQAQFPLQIQSITHGSINYNVFDLLTDSITVKDIQVKLTATQAVLHVGSLTIDHFNALEKAPYGSFGIMIKEASIQNVGNIYAYIIKDLDPNNDLGFAPFINVFRNVPPDFNQLTLNADMEYAADANTLKFKVDANQGKVLTYQNEGVLGSFVIAGDTLQDWQNTLHNLTILQSNEGVHLQGNIDVSDLQTALPAMGNFLQNLNYTHLPVSIDSTGSYSSNTQALQNQLIFKVDDLGSLTLNANFLLAAAAMKPYQAWAYRLSYRLVNPQATPLTAAQIPLYLQYFKLTYTDLSFIPRMLTYLEKNTGETSQELQADLVQSMQGATDLFGMPGLQGFSPTIVQFLFQNPQNISWIVNPSTPFPLNSHAFNQMLTVSDSDFRARLGMSVVTNQ